MKASVSSFQMCPAPIIIKKYDEKAHATAPNTDTDGLTLRERISM